MPDPATVATTAAKAAVAVARFRPWQTVKRHDRFMRNEYEDLNTWAYDDLEKEANALERARGPGRRLLDSDEALEVIRDGISGEFDAELTRIHEEFARRWRDRKREADRKAEALREDEGLGVRAWRRIVRKPWPENPDAEELKDITAVWEGH
jgi:hypothetical protein